MEKDTSGTSEHAALLTAARAGDEAAFSALTERYRRELRVHCYRMLGSFEDAEDLVQETFLRAWRSRETFEGRSSLRAWLYGIATNGCLDFLEKNQKRAQAPAGEAPAAKAPAADPGRPAEVAWLQPYPDRLLEPAGPTAEEPDVAVVARETIGLAFLVAIQFLPAKQRAVLILCDVLDWSAKEAAELLELSVASVNSALQRARATLRERQPDLRAEWKPGLDPDEQQRLLLEQYVSATERGDAAGLAGLLREDVRFAMPPAPGLWVGREVVVASWVQGGFGADWFGRFRCLLTRANRMPAVACYVRKPGESKYRPMSLDVLGIEEGLVKEITTFDLEPFVEAFDLPAEL
jgi:RNA polymerase sigma-70 factor, ECF subfamily